MHVGMQKSTFLTDFTVPYTTTVSSKQMHKFSFCFHMRYVNEYHIKNTLKMICVVFSKCSSAHLFMTDII